MNLLHRFSRVVIYNSSFTTDQVKEFDHYEELVAEKKYSKIPFQHDFGHGLKSYSWEGIQFKEGPYAVVCENLTKEQRMLLAPFCQCDVCQMHWYNPVKFFSCRHCYGCLYTDDDTPRQSVLKATREYIKKNGIVLPDLKD